MIDQHYPYSNQLAHSTVAKWQASSTQDLCNNSVEKPTPFSAPKPSNSSIAGSSGISNKKAQREKKKHWRLDQQWDQGRKNTSSTPTTGTKSGIR